MAETQEANGSTNGKAKAVEFDINLFTDYKGERVHTDKRFPGGRVRIYLPAPAIEGADELDEFLKGNYNKTSQELLNAGIIQNAYAERDWDILKYGGKKTSECADEEVLANIAKGLADINAEDFEDKARSFFEAAVFTEKAERKTSATKVVAKKLQSKGLTDLSDEEMDEIIKRRKARAAQTDKAAK